jgi:hypothetical protein
MSHDGSTLADTRWRHPAVTRSDYRRPAQRGETGRWAQLRADRPRIRVVAHGFDVHQDMQQLGARSRPFRPGRRRADRNGEFWGYPESRPFAELLIDSEEDLVLWPVLVGVVRESDR